MTDDFENPVGAVGDSPEGSGAEAVTVATDEDVGLTVWRKAPNCPVSACEGTWTGATLSLERFPGVSPVTLDALIRN